MTGRPSVAAGAVPCVLDTNVVLDWLLFEDPHGSRLGAAIVAGQLTWWQTSAMHAELLDVLSRIPQLPALQRWQARVDAVLTGAERWACRVETPAALPPAAGLRCSDAADQMFIDLAVARQAAWLFSRDKAVLRLARRLGLRQVQTLTPQAWCRRHAPDTMVHCG